MTSSPASPRLGVLGGTFDPIHLAHLVLAQEAQWQLGLERVIFVPAGQPWRKEGRPIAAAEHRLAMLRLALANAPGLAISNLELDYPGPSYTVETLATLRQEMEEDAELFFIMGQDALYDLSNWREPERIIRLARLAVAGRSGRPQAQEGEGAQAGLAGGASDYVVREDLEAILPGLSRRVVEISMPLIDISATWLRERVRQGLPIRYFVPPPVAEYIQRHRLYVDQNRLQNPLAPGLSS